MPIAGNRAWAEHDIDTASVTTNYLFSGEQFDPRIGQQYLRARYYNPNTGRFNRLDPFFGRLQDPQCLHKYLHTRADPVNGVDPAGLEFPLISVLGSISVANALASRKMESDLALHQTFTSTVDGVKANLGMVEILVGLSKDVVFRALLEVGLPKTSNYRGSNCWRCSVSSVFHHFSRTIDGVGWDISQITESTES